MNTLKETIRKLTELYSQLNECNDGFTCNLIINDIEKALKSYGNECCKLTLERASYEALTRINNESTSIIVDKESITNPENIILL